MPTPASLTSAAPRPRRRLFWKYVVVIVALVTTVLVASGAAELWFSYLETRDALVALQHEKAAAAAGRIEAFIREIEGQMGWTTLPLLASGPAALEQRRIDFVRLQRQVPAITDLSYLDAEGKEQLRISRLAMDVTGSAIDLSADPRFTEAVARRVYHGPVYFRKESEPYMAVAMAQSGGGVTVAEVNLKFIWDVVTQIRIGKAGRAYVVDESGTLIAHPDISLVLQKTSLAALPQVREALAPSATATPVARDVQGRRVLAAHAAIPGLRWTVFAEQPLEEALAPLQASLKRSLALLALGVALAVGASLVLARRMVRPIQALQLGAARIGGGELGHRIDVGTGDELETLAREFNRMTAALQDSLATLEQRVEDRTRELREALEQQTATAEILRVISSSPTEIQPVLDAVTRETATLCQSEDVLILLAEGDELRVVARRGRGEGPPMRFPITRGSIAGRAVLDRETVQVDDIAALPEDEYPVSAQLARIGGHRTTLAVPLIREGTAIGVIVVRRWEIRPFTPKQIALLRTFADQAVIAIENVRLFTELQQRNAEITEALEQQTATSEVLGVISESPTDVQPVFETILRNGLRLAGADYGAVFRFGNGRFRLALATSISPELDDLIRNIGIEPGDTTPLALCGRDLRPVRTDDLQADPRFSPPDAHRRESMRSVLAVPMMREGRLLGALTFHTRTVRPFTEKQTALVTTFARQAVIAIENVRLFTELQTKNAALTESLEQQTATADILRVISRSQTDVQPVFDAIMDSAVRLCKGDSGTVFRYDGSVVTAVAEYNARPEGVATRERVLAGVPPTLDTVTGKAILLRTVVHCPDIEEATDVPGTVAIARAWPYRTIVAVPLVRAGESIGTINVARTRPQAFSDREIDLLQTFADQAVIAIENARLFAELQARNAEVTEALEQQTATSEILRVISRTQVDVQPVFETIVHNAVTLCDGRYGVVYRWDGRLLHVVAHANIRDGLDEWLQTFPRALRPPDEPDLLRPVIVGGDVVRIDDADADPRVPDPVLSRSRGVRSNVLVPMRRGNEVLGVIAVSHSEPGAFTDTRVDLLRTFADQAVIAIENVRLFTELQERTSQLQVASRHKDEFLANMSHELRTPLNAIIGFSEVMLERMFGELNDKQEEYLNDILSSGRHLLALINDILDLSKIEAGKMELEAADFNLPVAIDNALTLVHERAARRGLTLTQEIDPRLGDFRGDERKIKQVLLNLLSNAIKFTPEGGRVEVRAHLKGDVVEIAVADTGVGIAPEDQELVFEEFRQVGTDVAKKHEGTGLGLALARRFVELHGGNLWLESEVGVGSTFTFALPVRR